MKHTKIRRRIPHKPFGWLCGMFVACLVTMVGVVQGFEPFTIFCRALVSGSAIGVTVALGVGVIRLANIPHEMKGKL